MWEDLDKMRLCSGPICQQGFSPRAARVLHMSLHHAAHQAHILRGMGADEMLSHSQMMVPEGPRMAGLLSKGGGEGVQVLGTGDTEVSEVSRDVYLPIQRDQRNNTTWRGRLQQ